MGEDFEQQLKELQMGEEIITTVTTTTTVCIHLTEEKARWLKDYMQNSLVADEDTTSRTNRLALFNAITGALK